jgi:RHS repeat-associated protein
VALERETLHVMDNKRRIALIETKTIDKCEAVPSPVPVQRYQLANHLGSASLELDVSGGLLCYEEYTPYGSSTFQAGRSAEVSLKRYRYTGKERDQENGFTYHGARYYAPWLGQWVAADPIGIDDGPNLYAYVGCNPLTAIDSTGYDYEKIVDQSDPYGGNLPPGGAPEPPPSASDAPTPPPADVAPAAPPPDSATPPPPAAAPPPAAPPVKESAHWGKPTTDAHRSN